MGSSYNIFVAFFCAIGGFLFDYDSGIIVASVKAIGQSTTFFHGPSRPMIGAVVSTFNGACFFGAMGAAWTNDKWGRKRTIQARLSPANVLIALLSDSILVWGCLGPLWLRYAVRSAEHEIAPPKTRGFMVGLNQQMVSIGFIVANWVGCGCAFLITNAAWRLPLGLQMVPAGMLLIGIQFLPYSPRWLLEMDRDDEAREVVYKLRGADTPEVTADREFAQMHDQIKVDALVRSRNVSDLWAIPAMVRRTLVETGVRAFMQFTGINVISYYGPQMYESLGSLGQSLLVQGIYGAVGPIANLFFIIFILDWTGRKKPLMFGAASFVALYSVLSVLLAPFPPGENQNLVAQKAAIGMIFLMSIVFSLRFGPVSWVLASEVFPTRTRTIGTSVATIANVGWKFYLLFVSLNAVDFIIIAAFFPETKGKSLEEMLVIFGDEVDPRQALEEHLDQKEYRFEKA